MRFVFGLLPRLAAMVAVVCAAMTLGGCLPSTREGPDRLFPIADETAAIKSAVQTADLFSQSAGYRNSYVLARMYAADLAYYQYEASLTHERQDVSFASDVVNIGLTSAVPLVSAKATKDVLGAAASALTGIRNAYDDDILLNRTIQILQGEMRANRAQVASTIYLRLKRSISNYPMPLALSDLEDYYRAGTISGALLAVSTNVAHEVDEAQLERNQIVANIVIKDENAPIVPMHSGTRISPLDAGGTPVDAPLSSKEVQEIQALVCAKVDGKLGPKDSETRTKIFDFLKDKEAGKSFSSRRVDGADRNVLKTFVDDMKDGKFEPKC